MIQNDELKAEDFVWKKGFENWKKIKDVQEFQQKLQPEPPQTEPLPAPTPVAEAPQKKINLTEFNPDERVIIVRIGNDRGSQPMEYGPFSVNQLKHLFKENRINGKTHVYTSGMKEFQVLADLPEFEVLFGEKPPVIKESDRRITVRKPFIARLFVQNNKKIFEGFCRDISIGGMQVLTNEFQGEAGDKISINVHPENSDYHFTASGVVVRLLEGNSGFSFRFQGLNEEAKRSIEKYLQDN